MEEDTLSEENGAADERVGVRLRAARKDKGMSLEQVAAETRIPQRHLVTIEEGEFANLPSRTYAIGFTRTYAKTVGLDEREMVDLVRAELADSNRDAELAPAKFEPGDPARVPSSKLAWISALAAVLLLVGGFSFYRTYFAPGIGPAPLQDENAQLADATDQPQDTAAQQVAFDSNGEVVFTSEMDGTWVKFYDASGERLYEAQMAAGESYTIPSDADGPQVWTGRPYALAITVGGQRVPKLSEEDEVVKDVAVTAEALLARTDQASAPPAESPIADAT